MTFHNDEDMKIATTAKKENEDNSEQIAIAFKLQQESGNIDKAKLLGKILALDIIERYLKIEYTQQKLILIRFCLTNFLTIFLNNESLIHIAIDELDLILSKFTNSKLNDNLTSEMYSIFLIAFNEKINVAEHIAKVYSQFCAELDKTNHYDNAIKIFNECEAITKSKITELSFTNINAL